MPVEFKSRFLRPCSGTLVLVGKREGSPCGNTLVFTLDTCITNIVPVVRKNMLSTNELDDSVSSQLPSNNKSLTPGTIAPKSSSMYFTVESNAHVP